MQNVVKYKYVDYVIKIDNIFKIEWSCLWQRKRNLEKII